MVKTLDLSQDFRFIEKQLENMPNYKVYSINSTIIFAMVLPQITINRVESEHDQCYFPLDSFKTAVSKGTSWPKESIGLWSSCQRQPRKSAHIRLFVVYYKFAFFAVHVAEQMVVSFVCSFYTHIFKERVVNAK